MSDIVTLGESLGLFTATAPGRLAHQRQLVLGFGGAESNVAIAACRLGVSSAWIGRLGDDEVGELISRELRAEGVTVIAQRDREVPTSLMLKSRPQTGRTRVSYYRQGLAGGRLQAADVPEDVIERAQILHVTGISAALGGPILDAVLTAITRARGAGVLVSFDVNHRESLWAGDESAKTAYRELAGQADLLFAGQDEAELMVGDGSPQENLERLSALGPGTVVIKQGEHGATALIPETGSSRVIRRAAHRVAVIDTVGAGDAFVAGWLSETVRDRSYEGRLATAILCGALACTVAGDWEASPFRADLESVHGDPVER